MILGLALVLAQVTASGAPERSAGIVLAETALRSELKDPDSAKFEWPYDFRYGTFRLGSKSATGWIICGTLNAKNGFGGYVGSQPAIVVIEGGVPVLALVDDARFRIIGKQCSALGMPVG
jgi:hypothetical protein